MAYIDTMLKAHALVSGWYGGQEAQVELAQVSAADSAAPAQRREQETSAAGLEYPAPAFLQRAWQLRKAQAAEQDGDSGAGQWQTELTQAMQRLSPAANGIREAALAQAAVQAVQDGLKRQGGWQASGLGQAEGGAAGWRERSGGESSTMEAISRFFERDARRYGG